jgi:hypothetical protein
MNFLHVENCFILTFNIIMDLGLWGKYEVNLDDKSSEYIDVSLDKKVKRDTKYINVFH